MICQPCQQRNHGDCPAAGSRPDLYVTFVSEGVSTAYLGTRTRCDCQHQTGVFVNKQLLAQSSEKK